MRKYKPHQYHVYIMASMNGTLYIGSRTQFNVAYWNTNEGWWKDFQKHTGVRDSYTVNFINGFRKRLREKSN